MSRTILDAVHEVAKGWHEAGVISDEKMHEFDSLCEKSPGSTNWNVSNEPNEPNEPDWEVMSMVRAHDDYYYHQGKAEMFTRVLRQRFSDLPKWVDAHLDNASTRDLDQWSDQFFTAKSLEDVFRW